MFFYNIMLILVVLKIYGRVMIKKDKYKEVFESNDNIPQNIFHLP